jgi:hypothetical protein
MRKLKIMYLLVACLLLFVLGGGAWAYQFNDVTDVEAWKGSYDSNIWGDAIGRSNFDTFGADRSGNTFTIFTKWSPYKDGTLGALTADLFINSDSIGAFEYAIRLDDTDGTAVVYANPTYVTSKVFYGDSYPSYWYGGKYDFANPQDPPVRALSGSSTFNTSVVWYIGDYGPDHSNKVDINLSGLNLGSDWSFFWGTGTCSNDAITGSEHMEVPEPTTMLLLGLGLIGLAGLRRKKM